MMTDDRPATYSVAQTAALTGMSKDTIHRAIHRGDIPAIRFGKAIQIPAHIVDQLLTDGNTRAAS